MRADSWTKKNKNIKDDNHNLTFFVENRPMDTKGQGATTPTAQVSFKGAVLSQ